MEANADLILIRYTLNPAIPAFSISMHNYICYDLGTCLLKNSTYTPGHNS